MEAGCYTFRELDGVYRRLGPTALSCMRYPEQKTLQAIGSIVHTKYSRFISDQISRKNCVFIVTVLPVFL